MKFITALILIPFLGLASIAQNQPNSAIETMHTPRMGLVSDFVFIKNVAEGVIRPIVNETSIRKDMGDGATDALACYFEVKLRTDQIISQLQADMLSRNSVRPYNRFDKYLRQILRFNPILVGPRPADKYAQAFDGLLRSTAFQKLILNPDKFFNESEIAKNPGFERYMKNKGGSASAVSPGDVLGWVFAGIEAGVAIEGAVREARKNKVDGIVASLEKLKLAEPTALKEKK